MTVTIAGIDFDRVDYDRDAHVLYLHVGEPASAVDWDESEEGQALRYGPDGSIVGITIVNARRTLEADGENCDHAAAAACRREGPGPDTRGRITGDTLRLADAS